MVRFITLLLLRTNIHTNRQLGERWKDCLINHYLEPSYASQIHLISTGKPLRLTLLVLLHHTTPPPLHPSDQAGQSLSPPPSASRSLRRNADTSTGTSAEQRKYSHLLP